MAQENHATYALASRSRGVYLVRRFFDSATLARPPEPRGRLALLLHPAVHKVSSVITPPSWRAVLLCDFNYSPCRHRFVPLVRDATTWTAIYNEPENTLPSGTLQVYCKRGWCRLEVLAALTPKKFWRGDWRPGPRNVRFRYHVRNAVICGHEEREIT